MCNSWLDIWQETSLVRVGCIKRDHVVQMHTRRDGLPWIIGSSCTMMILWWGTNLLVWKKMLYWNLGCFISMFCDWSIWILCLSLSYVRIESGDLENLDKEGRILKLLVVESVLWCNCVREGLHWWVIKLYWSICILSSVYVF